MYMSEDLNPTKIDTQLVNIENSDPKVRIERPDGSITSPSTTPPKDDFERFMYNRENGLNTRVLQEASQMKPPLSLEDYDRLVKDVHNKILIEYGKKAVRVLERSGHLLGYLLKQSKDNPETIGAYGSVIVGLLNVITGSPLPSEVVIPLTSSIGGASIIYPRGKGRLGRIGASFAGAAAGGILGSSTLLMDTSRSGLLATLAGLGDDAIIALPVAARIGSKVFRSKRKNQEKS